MHKVLFNIGGFEIYSYGFLVAVAFLVSVILMRKDAERTGLSFESALDCIIWTLILGLLGARLLFVLINWREYISEPLRILAFREGGMAFQGGLIAGALTSVIVCKLKKVPYLKFMDLMAPYAALGQAIGRIGCFLNGCCYGAATHSGLAVIFPGETVQRIPVQLYYTAALIIVYLVLSRIKRKKPFDGFIMCVYLMAFALIGFFMEFLRGDNPRLLGGLTLSQIIFIFLFKAGFLLTVILGVRDRFLKITGKSKL